MGSCIFSTNKDVNKIINEAESVILTEKYNLGELWKIKYFVAVDHNNKRWFSSYKQMKEIYDIAHCRVIDGSNYLTIGGNKQKIKKIHNESVKNKKKSIQKYKNFVKKNGYNSSLIYQYLNKTKKI